MDKNEQIVQNLLPAIGGKENITAAFHCMTRLRLNVKDKSLVNTDEIKKVDGVAGSQFVGDQLQVIVGTNVPKVYDIFIRETGLSAEAAVDENLDAPKKGAIDTAFDYISGSLTPVLSAFIAAGLFKTIIPIFGPDMLKLFTAESDIYTLLTIMGDAGFYFLPILIKKIHFFSL